MGRAPLAKKETVSHIITTETYKEIIEKENLAIPLKLYEKLWFNNLKGVRSDKIKFAMTLEEIQEYANCKKNVHYFAEKFCQIKREDGSIGSVKLRDYQKELISLYTENRYSLVMASRQVGKCISPETLIEIIDDNDVTEILTIGELYYRTIKSVRKLTFLENIKYGLYKLLKYLR